MFQRTPRSFRGGGTLAHLRRRSAYCKHSQPNSTSLALPEVIAIESVAFAGIVTVPDEVQVPPDVAQLMPSLPFTRRASVRLLSVQRLRFCASHESEVLGHRLLTWLSEPASDLPLAAPNLPESGDLMWPVKTAFVAAPPAGPVGPWGPIGPWGPAPSRTSRPVRAIGTSGTCRACRTSRSVRAVGTGGTCRASRTSRSVRAVGTGGTCRACRTSRPVRAVGTSGTCRACRTSRPVRAVGTSGTCRASRSVRAIHRRDLPRLPDQSPRPRRRHQRDLPRLPDQSPRPRHRHQQGRRDLQSLLVPQALPVRRSPPDQGGLVPQCCPRYHPVRAVRWPPERAT